MSAKLACLAGATVYRMLESGQFKGQELPRRQTPFGLSEPVFLIDQVAAPFYLMPRHGRGLERPAPWQISYRANLYALKDLGVEAVVSWSPVGAITHNLHVGNILLPDDVLDMTSRRPNTLFENCALGFLRQFPVFCKPLREAISQSLSELGVHAETTGTVAVTEGPRLETPAEVRMLATVGAQVVTHTIAPDVFLAKELQLCYAGICYIVNYAETGSTHRPFSVGALFDGLSPDNQEDRLSETIRLLPALMEKLADKVNRAAVSCECHQTMAEYAKKYNLSPDWRQWFE